jgi:hypothetical protein
MKAAELNNRGVSLLELGQLEAASCAFKDALKATRDQLNLLPADSENVLGTQRPDDSVRSWTPHSWITDRISSGGSSFLVYRVPERICPKGLTPNSLDSIPTSVVVSILFNLSLTHHLRAMASRSPAAYETALQLYEHTYRLITQDKSADLFLPLAVLNNVAHVQYKMENLLAADRTCGLLWRAVLDIEEQESSMSSMVEGFCTNVIQVTFKHSQSAAAA